MEEHETKSRGVCMVCCGGWSRIMVKAVDTINNKEGYICLSCIKELSTGDRNEV